MVANIREVEGGSRKQLTMPSSKMQFDPAVTVSQAQAGSSLLRSAEGSAKSVDGDSFQNSSNAAGVPSLRWIKGSRRGRYLWEVAPRAYSTSAPTSLAAAEIPCKGDTV